jgi:DNA-binding MarR family transcriptional regulator
VRQTAPKSATTIDHQQVVRLRLAVGRLARRLRQQAGDEITPSQLSALSSVGRLGPLTLGELAAVERVRPPTMTRIVASLEEAGLVDRSALPGDRRVARVALSNAGRRFLERTGTRKDAFLAKRLARLDPDEVEQLGRAVVVLEHLLEDDG